MAPPRTRIDFAPRLGQVFRCELPTDARKPEFWKTRPIMVISFTNQLIGPIPIVPPTTSPRQGNKWVRTLPGNPVPGETRPSWAACNHLYTVSCGRLPPVHGAVGRLDETERRPILDLVRLWVASAAPMPPKPPRRLA